MAEFDTTVQSVRDETHDVKTLQLAKPGGFTFIPGQYGMVSIPGRFEADEHPFTFSNSPTDRFLQLTIKRMGAFTTAIHGLAPGANLRVRGPLGEKLNFDENVRHDVVFVAGGSGITPFMSSLQYAVRKRLTNNLLLIYSNRTIDDIIFRKELDAIRARNVRVVHTITAGAPAGWTGEHGYVSKEMFDRYVDHPEQNLWYICGPPPMIDSVKKILSELGVSETRMRIEPWQLPAKGGA